MKPAITVENLSKVFQVGTRHPGYRTFREMIVEGTKAPGRRLSRYFRGPAYSGKDAACESNTHWALRDVSLVIQPGQVVGVIGRNGAGKSTLLRILSRITEPTEGRIKLRGRVGSLLEVGTGFHPELTGRENIYLSGAILGMTRREIKSKYDDMVAFAEADQFLDTPVKRYSSGMYVRLAFAVASHLDPEILLIDEVLAVGDSAFQTKCLARINQVTKSGRTVVLVSHNMASVQNVCRKVIVLSAGQLQYEGTPEQGIAEYLRSGKSEGGGEVDLSSHETRSPGSSPLLRHVRLLNSDGQVTDRFLCGEPMSIELLVHSLESTDPPRLSIGVNDVFGSRVFSLGTMFSLPSLPPLKGPAYVRCSLAELPLAPGRYSLSLGAGSVHNPLIDALQEAVCFDVEPCDYFGTGQLPHATHGRVLVRSSWEVMD